MRSSQQSKLNKQQRHQKTRSLESKSPSREDEHRSLVNQEKLYSLMQQNRNLQSEVQKLKAKCARYQEQVQVLNQERDNKINIEDHHKHGQEAALIEQVTDDILG